MPFRNTLQPLVWSIGSVSGTMTEDQERHLLVATIMDLLRVMVLSQFILKLCIIYLIILMV